MNLNTTGSYNTAYGVGSLYSSTTATGNTSLGYYSSYSNTTGSWNTSVGHNSLSSNTTGQLNTAIGRNSLSSNTTGSYNTVNGSGSLYSNTTGIQNTALGYGTLPNNTTGTNNTGVGMSTLVGNTTGSGNVALGISSLQTNISGSDNIAIGNVADVASSALSNAIAIGAAAIVSTSNTIQLGNASITDVKTSGAITAAGFKIAGGTSTQTIMADGSVSSSMVSILNKILFVKFINGSRPEVWIANYDGTNSSKVNITLPTGIEFEDGLENLKMSPDGNKIFFNAGPAASLGALYAGSTDIYSCNSDGSSVTKIIDRATSNKVLIRSAQ